MAFAQDLFLWAGLFCVFLLLVGFIRPTLLLWWEDTQNRARIVKIYGSAAIGFLTIYLISLLILG